jgi:thermitase
MLEYLYPYLVVGLSLSILWVFYKIYSEKSTILPNISFWGASIFYAITVFLTDFSFYHKLLLMLPRDLMVFVMVFLLANNLKSTRGFFLAAMGVGFAGYMLYSNFVPETVQHYWNAPTTQTIEDNSSELARDGEILLDIKEGKSLTALRSVLEPYGVTFKKAFPEMAHPEWTTLDEYYVLDVPEDKLNQLDAIIDVLYKSNLADWIERNEVVKISPLELIPSKPSPQPIDYGINDPSLEQMWGFEKMQVAAYFDYLRKEKITPKKRAKIAILDTGVEGKHEDLKGNYVSTRSSYDSDKQTHGTHCAGIAAAVSNNGVGVASLSLNNKFVQVTSIKVLSDYGWGTQRDIINGMLEASDKGADVISMSLGGPSSDAAQKAYEEAIRYVQKSKAIVVVAAGNDNKNAKNSVPASCKGVIVVSAINSEMKKASFSNFITDMEMGIAAPGQDILSTVPGNKYAAYSGTSMATPYVAGLLGVLKSLNPEMNTADAYKILKNTGTKTLDDALTGKLINPLGAVKATQK